jgi:hypothetical protein
MLLNALTNYLQNQPPAPGAAANAEQTAEQTATAATQAVSPADAAANETANDGPALYEVSDRAVMVSAVASEFDVAALEVGQLGAFQSRLQEYGLIDNRGIQALSLVHTARRDLNEGDTIVNAKAIIDDARQHAWEDGGSYSERQQIQQLHTLFSNLHSARPQ